ncbi:hypothetical protein CsSME_00002240 [Camellia sinensis var. sinensis]
MTDEKHTSRARLAGRAHKTDPHLALAWANEVLHNVRKAGQHCSVATRTGGGGRQRKATSLGQDEIPTMAVPGAATMNIMQTKKKKTIVRCTGAKYSLLSVLLGLQASRRPLGLPLTLWNDWGSLVRYG